MSESDTNRSHGDCPKCGRKRDSDAPACPRCGLRFALWNPSLVDPRTKLTPAGLELWRQVEAESARVVIIADDGSVSVSVVTDGPPGPVQPDGARWHVIPANNKQFARIATLKAINKGLARTLREA